MSGTVPARARGYVPRCAEHDDPLPMVFIAQRVFANTPVEGMVRRVDYYRCERCRRRLLQFVAPASFDERGEAQDLFVVTEPV